MKIVAFPFHDWRKGDVEGRRWRDAHIIDALAALPEVEAMLVIDRPVSLAERLVRRQDGWAVGQAGRERTAHGAHARITRVGDKVQVLDIHVRDLVGPVLKRRGWWFQTFAEPRIHDQILWAVADTGIDAPSVFAWTPTVAPAVLALRPGALLFDSLDNWIIHPRLRNLAGPAADGYAALLPRATAVVASAPASREVLARWADEVTVIPNGVDPGMFAGTYARPEDLPPGPIVGYAGTLASRIDADLIVRTATALPAVAFVFVGPTFEPTSVRRMRRLRNVHILGNRHYSRVPAYVSHFDVAWIPHSVGAGETGGDPIKMYEYWAAGREVVATPIDGLEQWSDRLHLVRTAEEATRTIAGLLDGSLPRRHATVPADRTWDAIARRMIGLIRPDPGDPSGRPGATS